MEALRAEDRSAEQLRLDYGETTQLLRTLTDVRFKLLAFVPTISGAAVGLLGRAPSTAELLAVGVVGLVATSGIVLYELRNTQLQDYAVERAKTLEEQLGPGGLYSGRPDRAVRVLGVTVGHDRGLALVYGAAVAGWSYLVAWGALRALDVGSPQKLGGAIGAAAGLVALVELLRVGNRMR